MVMKILWLAVDVMFLLWKYLPAFLQIQVFQAAMPQLIKGFAYMTPHAALY